MQPIRGLALAACVIGLAGTLWERTEAASDPNTVRCSLKREAAEFKGTCDIPCAVNALAIDIDGQRPNFSCSQPARRVNASVHKQEHFDDWLGTMQGKEPEDPTRFGLIKPKDGKPGVAKMPYGWFALTEATLDGDVLNLTILANRQLPPTQDDTRIIQRAIALLSNTTVWNKQDDRECPANPAKWSVFCARRSLAASIIVSLRCRRCERW
jgi:hypothetical protein